MFLLIHYLPLKMIFSSAFFQGMEECALLILGKIPESALVATNAALQT